MGVKKNIIYNGILTSSIYVFQFITYPYIARVLGVTNFGLCNYVQSIVSYFMIFSMFGIEAVGIREISKCGGDQTKVSKVFSRIFSINLYLTLIVAAIYITCIETVSALEPYKKLLYIGASQLIFNLFIVEWFYKGTEKFKFITIRTLIVRTLYVLSIFVFVRSKEDYTLYFVLYSAMIVLNALINWMYLRRMITFCFSPLKKLKPYVKPLLYLGSRSLSTTMCTTFNVAFLGFITTDTQVGYYTTATKIQAIILSLYTAFTLVMMPRISALLAQGNVKEGKVLIRKSFDLLFAFAFPVIIIGVVFAPELINIISGSGYEGAILPFRIIMPSILIFGLEQILIYQILLPLHEDKAVFINSLAGVAAGLLFNFILVQKYMAAGSSLVWVLSELVILIAAACFVSQKFEKTFPVRQLIKYISSFLPLFAACWLLRYTSLPGYWQLTIGIILTAVYYHISMMYIIKSELYTDAVQRITLKLQSVHKHNRFNRS